MMDGDLHFLEQYADELARIGEELNGILVLLTDDEKHIMPP